MRSRKAVTAIVATASALVLSGCLSQVALIHTADGYVHVAHDVADPVCETPIDGAAGELIGPHFGLRVTCVGSGPSIALMSDIDMSGVYPASAPPPVRSGQEFIVVQFDDESVPRPYHTPSSADDLTMHLLVGDERVEIEEPPLPGDVLVAVGPVGEPAFLVVEDVGREQRFDLREEKRSAEIAGYYQAEEGLRTTDGYEVRQEGENSRWTGWAEGSGDISVVRTLWTPDAGYAEDGRAHLVVRVTWYVHERDGKIGWDMKIKSSVTLRSSDAEYEIVDVAEDDDGKRIHYEVLFDAPSDVTEFVVGFRPDGKLWIVDDGSKLDTTKRAKKAKHTVDFSR